MAINVSEEFLTSQNIPLSHPWIPQYVYKVCCADSGCIVLQAQGFHGEIEDMQQWLKDTERQLLASKAVGGLPDTAREQLNAHLVCI